MNDTGITVGRTANGYHGRVRASEGYMLLHADLFVRCMPTALDFYCSKLGYRVVDESLLEGPIARCVSDGHYDAVRLVLLRSTSVGAMIELQEFQSDRALTAQAANMPLRAGWLSILVPDLQVLTRRLQAQHVSPRSDVFQVKLPNSRTCEVVFYEDPDGNVLEFIQIAR